MGAAKEATLLYILLKRKELSGKKNRESPEGEFPGDFKTHLAVLTFFFLLL